MKEDHEADKERHENDMAANKQKFHDERQSLSKQISGEMSQAALLEEERDILLAARPTAPHDNRARHGQLSFR